MPRHPGATEGERLYAAVVDVLKGDGVAGVAEATLLDHEEPLSVKVLAGTVAYADYSMPHLIVARIQIPGELPKLPVYFSRKVYDAERNVVRSLHGIEVYPKQSYRYDQSYVPGEPIADGPLRIMRLLIKRAKWNREASALIARATLEQTVRKYRIAHGPT